MITECCELSNSNLIATASLDGYIRLWTHDELKLKTELEDMDAKKAASKTKQSSEAATRNIAGIRSLSYTPENGGYLLSAGYTPYINVWSPDTSLSKAFVGRLEGHAGVVLSARFFHKSTLAVSVDDRFNIRTWDLRYLKPLQNIRNETLNPATVSCLATIPGEGRFIIGGRRMLLFTNEHTKRDLQAFQDELYPMEIDFNPYFGTLQVLTKHDVRVFSAFSGKIKQVFTDLFHGGVPVELTAMSPGPRDRKFFLADNSGNFKLFNARSGDQIKALLDSDSLSPGEKKLVEITQVIFVENQGLILMVANDASIRIAEWKANGDSIELLRELRGGHKGADITCAIYSRETLSLYTGGSEGGIANWAFESAKLAAYFKHSNSDITAIQDLFPYPAIAATDSKGMLAIYKTRDWKKSAPLLWLIPTLDQKGIPRPLTSMCILADKRTHKFTLPLDAAYKKASADSAELVHPTKIIGYTDLTKLASSVQNEHFEMELFVAGTAGLVQVVPVEALLRLRGVEPLPASDFNSKRWERFKVSLMRKDNVNAEISVQKSREELSLLYPPPEARFFGLPADLFISKKWKAHTDAVTVISPLSMFSGMLTGGKDRLIKLWSNRGELWGTLSLLGLQAGSWRFPLDWVTKVLTDLDDVLALIALLEKAEFAPDQLPLIQTRYLFRNYILPEAKVLNQIDKKDIFSKIRFFQRLATDTRPLPEEVESSYLTAKQAPRLNQEELEKVRKQVNQRLEQLQKLAQEKSAKPREPSHNVFRNRYDLNRGFWDGIEKESFGRARKEFDNLLFRNEPEPKGIFAKKIGHKMREGWEEGTAPPAEVSAEEKPNLHTSALKAVKPRMRDMGYLRDSEKSHAIRESREIHAPEFRLTGLPRPMSLGNLHGKATQKGWNIKCRQGESKTVLWNAALSSVEQQNSQTGSRMHSDLGVVRSNQRLADSTIKHLVAQQSSRPNTVGLGKEKIVAKKSFFLNPSVHSMKNMKIIRTGQGVYVI